MAVTAGRDGAGRREATLFELTGGRLALDFVNTVDGRPTERRTDHLATYGDLVAWGRQAGALDGAAAKALLSQATRRPEAAEAALRRARSLREALFRILWAAAAGAAAAAADVAELNAALRRTAAAAALVPARAGFAWGWTPGPPALDDPMRPVVRDASALLTSPALARLRECAAEDCAWLFLDESRNRSRVWCSMSGCGNRAKARRHYEKEHAGG